MLSFVLDRSGNKMCMYLLITAKIKNTGRINKQTKKSATKKGWGSIWLSILKDKHIFLSPKSFFPAKNFPI